jgi:hypothetical protein
MRIDSSGNVGIGTSTPAVKLDVIGAGRFSSTLLIADNTAVNFGLSSQIYHNSANAATHFTGTNGTDTVVIKDSGNVGIGTTSPSVKLDINGGVRYRGSIYDEFTFEASGDYSNGTYYNMLTANTIAEGVYIITGYIDTYAAGGGIYFMKFASIPFYIWAPGSNSVTYTDIPEPIGSGHHKGASLPLFRLQQQGQGSGGNVFLQFNPNASAGWTGIDGSSGKRLSVYLKRISGL